MGMGIDQHIKHYEKMSALTAETQRTQRFSFFVCPRSYRTDKKGLMAEISKSREARRTSGESSSPPYTSRDLRPILQKLDLLGDLRVSNEPHHLGASGR